LIVGFDNKTHQYVGPGSTALKQDDLERLLHQYTEPYLHVVYSRVHGYQGDRRSETAALVVRRQHIGSGSNDLGFARTAEGYHPIISQYDTHTLLSGRFLPQAASCVRGARRRNGT
jgi:hypothetical protein